MAAQTPTFELLFERYGPLISGRDLARVSGFRSTDALRMAAGRGSLGFEVFSIPGRRGRFARTEDVASWLEATGRILPRQDEKAP